MARRNRTSLIPVTAMATFLGLYLLLPPSSGVAPASSRPGTSRHFPNCDAARAAGAAPIHAGQSGYREELDGDGDGIACEPYRR